MKYRVKVTVIDKKLYPELQEKYCADPNSGACPCYNVGDEFIFERDEENDHFWHGGLNTLVKTDADPDAVAGGPKMPHCSEAWDAIARYIYAGLQGGSICRSLRQGFMPPMEWGSIAYSTGIYLSRYSSILLAGGPWMLKRGTELG